MVSTLAARTDAAVPTLRRNERDLGNPLQRILVLPHPRPLLFTFIILIPLVWNVFLSFTDYRGIRPPEFIGLENWIELVSDRSSGPRSATRSR